MNAKQLKTAFISDIDALIKLTAEDVSKGFEYTLESFIEVQEPLTPKKRLEITEKYLRLHELSDENISFEYGAAKYELSPVLSVYLRGIVSAKFPNGSKPEQKEKSKKEQDKNGLDFQQKIKIYRDAYQNGETEYKIWGYFSESWKTMYKEEVIEKYEKAAENDLIRLCWKYITNPAEVEGVNVAWKEEPKAIFEPYKETVKKMNQ